MADAVDFQLDVAKVAVTALGQSEPSLFSDLVAPDQCPLPW